MRTCYRLYSLSGNEKPDADIIRRQILRAQALSLLIAAKYPVLCMPTNNGESISPSMYDITKEEGAQFASKIRAKLSEIERLLSKHSLTYEYSI